MYAVIRSGGKQYRVEEGDVLRVEKLPGERGSAISFNEVLMYSDGRDVEIGQPLLENIAVDGHITEQGKAKKIIVFKYKRRKRYRRKAGHRQHYTAVAIDRIQNTASAADEDAQEDELQAQQAAVEEQVEAKDTDMGIESPAVDAAAEDEAVDSSDDAPDTDEGENK